MPHTKGPWHFDGHGINGTDGERICKITHSEPYNYPNGKAVRNERFDADSNLIAMAPELLEVLKRIHRLLSITHPESIVKDITMSCEEMNRVIQKTEAQ